MLHNILIYTLRIRTSRAVYEYSPFECLPIYAYMYFCLDLCHGVALCLLLIIHLCPTGPAGEVPNLGLSLSLGHL